ncbi:MAG: hypothetical protein AAF828_01260 [Bacteroidota bacterium]
MSFIKDIFELDVVTVTGSIDINMEDIEIESTDTNKVAISFDTIFKTVGKDVMNVADLRIIAASKIKIDKDTYTFVAEPTGDRDLDLINMHFDAVNTALEGRSAIAARLGLSVKRNDDGDIIDNES